MCNRVHKEKIIPVTLFISCTKVQASLEVNNSCDIIDVTFCLEIFLAKRKPVLLEAHGYKEKKVQLHFCKLDQQQLN